MAQPNELHDVHFSKARVVLNNNVKRLWFKINPFLERKETLQNFSHPEKLSKFVRLLQSSVVCEQYFRDETNTFQDVTIEEFWDFLYSDKWSHGCSLRILDGQLLDYLITALYILVQTNIVGHHTTFAFARNQRERRGCYKISNNKEGCQIIEETLLLEFTYYGRKSAALRISNERSCSTSYPGTTTDSPFQTITEEEEDDGSRPLEMLVKSRNRRKSLYNYKFDPYSSNTFKRNSMFSPSDADPKDEISRRLEYMVKSGSMPSDSPEEVENALKSWAEAEQNKKSPLLEKAVPKNCVEIIPVISDIHSDETRSSQASAESDYKLKARTPNLAILSCTERINYGDGLQVEVVDDRQRLENLDTGEEFYLGDKIESELSSEVSVSVKLKKRLQEKYKAREERKREEIEWKQHNKGIPIYKEIDFKAFEMSKKVKHTPGRTPTFEEFLQLLEDEEKYDPRFRRAKQITKKIVKRYNIQGATFRSKDQLTAMVPDGTVKNGSPPLPPIDIKGTRRENHNGKPEYSTRNTMELAREVGGVTDSHACEKWIIDQYGRKRPRPPGLSVGFSRTMSSDDVEEERSVSAEYRTAVRECFGRDSSGRDTSSTEPEHPIFLLTTPSGIITEIEIGEGNSGKTTPKLINETKTSLPPVAPIVVSREDEMKADFKKSSKTKSAKSRKSSLLKSKKSSPKSKKNNRITLLEEEEKSSESDLDQNIEDETKIFDTKKLNTKYSFERLKGKRVKKKPSFYETLKKYYKIQRVVNKFAGGSARKKGGRRGGIFARLIRMPPEEEKEEEEKFVIGKMKKFDFLNHKPPRLEEEEPVSFVTSSMLDFTAKVLNALDDFVVRKEQIVSDYCSKSSMTITFTRKSVFSFNMA